MTIPTTTVSVRSFGAAADGIEDDTYAFQQAHDYLTEGGTIFVDGGTYLVERIDITHRNIAIVLDTNAVLKKKGPAGPTLRGIFWIEDLPDAGFSLRGGTIDLNGEGPMGIGIAGRIANNYAPQTIPTITALAGPANAAIYGLRSSHVVVADTTILNSGENGLLFRDCGDTAVIDSRFINIANYGIEWSFIGETDEVPERARMVVRGCYFEDHDDYGLGSGNGAGVGGGGDIEGGVFKDYEITDCVFVRCQRDLNIEFPFANGYVQGLKIRGLRSYDARQIGFGLIGVRDATVEDYIILNPGYAPTSALNNAGWPTIAGGTLSSDFEGVKLSNVQVLDQRNSMVRKGTDGAIAANSNVFTSASAAFTANDVGTFLGILGANPSNVCYVGRIVSVDSPTQVTLDLDAAVTVTGATYAYGGACREGLRIYHGGSADIVDCRVEAGVHSGLDEEPEASGIVFEGVTGLARLAGTTVTAPFTPGTTPVGVRLADYFSGKLLPDTTNLVTGFDEAYVGLRTRQASVDNVSYVSPNGAQVTPAAAANTYGDELLLTPRRNHWQAIYAMSVDFADLASENVSALVTFYRYDGGSNTHELQASVDRYIDFRAIELALLNQNNEPIRAVGVRTKSTIASSAARARVVALALEG